jgi:hypothetical protein
MGVGAAVVRADWLALDLLWVAPTNIISLNIINRLLFAMFFCEVELNI